MNDIKYYSITALNRAIKNMFDSKPELNNVFIKGEISNFKHHTRGHLYFTLKDENSRIAAVMFAGPATKLKFEPEDGMKVLVAGRVTVYEQTGGYQIYVEQMDLDGIGNLYLEYEKLKKQLEQEGLFSIEHKRPIPKYPKRIGIITAPTGAAIRDILSTIKRRYPICETILFPALVQGTGAKESIVEQLNRAQDFDLDVIICGRGGGSIEDLWAFNEEIVARAIYNSKIPVISAVGHEIDFTIADFVADLRAPTPTGAAEMAVPNLVDLKTLIEQYKIRMNENIKGIINYNTKRLDSIRESYILKNPLALYEVKEQKLDTYIDRLNGFMSTMLNDYKNRLDNIKSSYVLKNPLATYEVKRERINNLESILNKIIISQIDVNKHKYEVMINKLELLNPLNILSKGYSLVTVDGMVVKDTNELKIEDTINIRMHKGNVKAIVKEIDE
ncbi:MAG: exodeoxyribonuclease VII large subunit [Bacilli bacterium]|nr:exodeoxyribonuclease VII large subunit [Bacillota bacterium]MBR6820650.1 exodeoxyribonuclease VII large subunit [Bacilli bacterium]